MCVCVSCCDQLIYLNQTEHKIPDSANANKVSNSANATKILNSANMPTLHLVNKERGLFVFVPMQPLLP